MKKVKTLGNIAFLSTYPSRECGIATFTEDLVTTLDHSGTIKTQVIAVSDTGNCTYDNKVIAEIRQNIKKDYIDMVKKLNASNFDLLVIEHEFELFGGEQGEYILELVSRLEIPLVTTFHTIPSKPDTKQHFIINELGKKSVKMFVMANNSKDLLEATYGIDADKINVIHHGVPKKPFQAREDLKLEYGYEDRQIISTFGLLRPGNGIEDGIEAIAKLAKEYKQILYLVLGTMHPSLKNSGKEYIDKLEKLVCDLEMEDHVIFIKEYLTKVELIKYIQLTDIYLTPYLTEDKAVSGTLAYAVGYGKAIVSTPYFYANEMLSKGTGMLAEFHNPDSLVECISQILKDPYKKSKMERDTSKIGRMMYWDKIATLYTKIFVGIINDIADAKVL